MSLKDIPLRRIDGTETKLADFSGKVVMVVNVASKCGLTPQYEGLEKLFQEYGSKGFTILGFPSNQFLGQEPGSNEEIQEFCKLNYGVSFPLFQKIDVKGEGQHPLYKELTKTQPKAQKKGLSFFSWTLKLIGQGKKQSTDILWNFEKFLINKKGEVIARFAPDVKPEEAIIKDAIEAELRS